MLRDVWNGIVGTAEAMWVTLRHLFKPPVTNQYPREAVAVYPRFRGRHVLKRYDDGLERCIGCSLCAPACPTDCILVVAAENTEENRRSPGERYAEVYEINLLRCIFCGYCAEACPTEAMVLHTALERVEDRRVQRPEVTGARRVEQRRMEEGP